MEYQQTMKRPHEMTAYKCVDDFDFTVIRNKIQWFYTINSLNKVLCDDIYFPGSRHRHDKLLNALGYPKRKHGIVEQF